ncbi:hypothetical protein ONK29_27180, partial [Salmonella enterica subsp. enterica serovar Anatum]|nr:hypothetical protein [Salmonella enterica subsp. enterica serovar Anatum]
QFLTHTLRPLLVNIEQEIGRCLLDSDNDVFAEFSVEGLLRADQGGTLSLQEYTGDPKSPLLPPAITTQEPNIDEMLDELPDVSD